MPFRLAKELKQICRLRSNCFCTLIVLSFDTKNLSRNISVPEIFDVAHILVRSPPFSPKMISHKTTFEKIFFNNVVAYAFNLNVSQGWNISRNCADTIV